MTERPGAPLDWSWSSSTQLSTMSGNFEKTSWWLLWVYSTLTSHDTIRKQGLSLADVTSTMKFDSFRAKVALVQLFRNVISSAMISRSISSRLLVSLLPHSNAQALKSPIFFHPQLVRSEGVRVHPVRHSVRLKHYRSISLPLWLSRIIKRDTIKNGVVLIFARTFQCSLVYEQVWNY